LTVARRRSRSRGLITCHLITFFRSVLRKPQGFSAHAFLRQLEFGIPLVRGEGTLDLGRDVTNEFLVGNDGEDITLGLRPILRQEIIRLPVRSPKRTVCL